MQKDRLREIRHVALDMDGTLYRGSTIFEFTPAFLRRLGELQIGHTFLTNNCSKSREDYLRHLRGFGITARTDQIYTSGLCTIDYLRRERPHLRRLFVLGTSSLFDELRGAGFAMTAPEEEPDAVVVGIRLSRTGLVCTMSRQDATTRRRQLILSTALTCFAERGVQATTLAAIHRRAAVSIGSIYHHFPSKELLVRTVYLEGLEAYHQDLLFDLEQYDTAQAGIEALVRFDLRCVALPAVWSRYTFPAHELRWEPAVERLVAGLQQEFACDLALWLSPHIQHGDILALPIAFYLMILFGPTREFAEGWVGGQREPTLAQAQDVLPAAAWMALRSPAAT